MQNSTTLQKGQKSQLIKDWALNHYNEGDSITDALASFRTANPSYSEITYSYFRSILVSITPNPVVKQLDENEEEIEEVETSEFETYDLVPTSINDCHFDPESLKAMKVGNGMDILLNKHGDGVKPATTNLVIGEPASGKTTLLINMLQGIQEQNPSRKVAAINGEMSRLDFYEETDDALELRSLPMFFLLDYKKQENGKPYHLPSVLKSIFDGGYDCLVVDSFKIIVDRIQENTGWTAKKCERWFVDELLSTASKHNTALFIIQQLNKSGSAAGSMSLQHDTTSMMFVRTDKATGERFIMFSKNRRCGKHQFKRLYFYKNEKGRIIFDQERFEAQEKALQSATKEKQMRKAEEDAFDFLISGNVKANGAVLEDEENDQDVDSEE